MHIHKLVKYLWVGLAMSLVFGCSGGNKQQADSLSGPRKSAKALASDFQMTTDPNDQSQPAVAFDSVNHQYLTVWTDSRNVPTSGYTDIYGRIYLGKNTYSDGKLRFDNTTSSATKTASALNPVTAEIRISNVLLSDNKDGNKSQPKVAFYPDYVTPANSRFLVVWSDARNGYSQIYGQRVKTDGTLDGVNFHISDHVDSSSFPGTVSSPAAYSTGTITVYEGSNIVTGVGTDFVGAGLTSGCTITISGTNYLISSVDSPTRLTLTTIFGSVPPNPGSISVTNGSPTVTGTGTSFALGGAKQIVIGGVTYNITTVTDATNLTLSINFAGSTASNLPYSIIGGPNNVSGGAYVAYPSSMSLVGTGTKFATNQISPNNMIKIGFQYYTITSVSDDTHISIDKPLGIPASSYEATLHTNQSDPDIVYNPVTKQFTVAWTDTTSYDTDHSAILTGTGCINGVIVYYLSYAGMAADNNMIVSATVAPTTGTVSAPNMRSNPISNGGFTDSGASLSASWGVSVNEASPKLAFNANSGEDYISWAGIAQTSTVTVSYTKNGANVCTYSAPSWAVTNKDATKKVKLRRNAGLGLVQDFSFGTDVNALTVATDPNTNRMLLAWEDNSGGSQSGKDILGQLFDFSSVTSYGNTIPISTTVGDQTAPSAGFDNVNQRYLVAWEDARNLSSNLTGIDVYGQFVDPQGNLSGGNSIITMATGNQLAPAVSFGDVYFRKFLVPWKDGRLNNNSDIFAQLMEYSVAPQLVLTDSNNTPILNGAIDFGNVNTGSTKTMGIKLRNDGNAQLTISSMTIPGLPFSFTTPSPVTISPGTSWDMTIQFAPTAAGSYAGNTSNNFKTVINSDGGQATLYLSGNGVGINAVAMTTSTLPDIAINGAPGAVIATLAASGGVYPYTWSSSGLPTGLSLDPTTGVLTQTGTVAAGTYNITFTITDNNSPKTTLSRTLTINAGAVSISTSSVPQWTQNRSGYSATLAATTGPNYTWSVASGSLPPGLSLSSSGTISGTPTSPGAYSFTVQADGGSGQIATKTLTLTINPALTIQNGSLTSGVVGQAYSQAMASNGGTAPITWSITSGALPPGLSFDAGSGTITGTPTSTGTYDNITFQVQDSSGATVTKSLSLSVGTQSTGGAAPVDPGTSNAPPSSGGKSGCFIATAAFGSYLDPHVMVLRHFRDDFLLKTRLGTRFVEFYYDHSPPIADFISRHDGLRAITRWALTPLIFAVEYSRAAVLLFCAATLAGAFGFRRARQKS